MKRVTKAMVIAFILVISLVGEFGSCAHTPTQPKWSGWVEVKNDSPVVAIPVCKPELENISALVAEVRYVPLETTKASRFSCIDRMEIYKDKIYLLNTFAAEGVLIFDLNGKFISKAGAKGNDPGGVISANKMSIDSYNDYLIIADLIQHKLIYYSLSGEYVKDIPLSISRMGDFASVGKNCLAFSNRPPTHNPTPGKFEQCRIICADTLGNVLGGIYEQEVRICFTAGMFEFLNYRGITYFNPITIPCIYTITDSILEQKYVFDYTALEQKKSPLPNNQSRNIRSSSSFGEEIADCLLFVENDSFIAFRTRHDFEDYTTFYDKEGRRAVSTHTHPRYTADNPYPMAFYRLTSKDDYFVGYAEPDSLLQWDELCVEENGSSRLPELCSKLQKDDNMVLVFFKLKSSK